MPGSSNKMTVEQLEQELKEQEARLINDFPDIKSVLDDGLELIEKAKRALAEDNLVDAYIAITRLKARMAQCEGSNKLLRSEQPKHFTLFWRIFLYNLMFLLIALAIGWLVIFGPFKIHGKPDETLPPVWLASWFLLAFAAGLLGAVLISLYGLVKHYTAGNLDRSYVIWYWCKPFIGALSGAVAAIPFLGGIFIFNISDRTPIMVTSIASVAFLAGFYERYFLKLIDRLGEVVLAPGDKKDTEKTEG